MCLLLAFSKFFKKFLKQINAISHVGKCTKYFFIFFFFLLFLLFPISKKFLLEISFFDTNLDCLISRPPAQLLSWDFPSSVFCIKPLFPEFYVFPFLDLLGWSKFAMCPEKGCMGDTTDAVDAQPHIHSTHLSSPALAGWFNFS